jgi:polysaccharide deacetylase 2 family uncharacterized protein YibQ
MTDIKPVNVNEAYNRVAAARHLVADARTILTSTVHDLDTKGLDNWDQKTVISSLAESADELHAARTTHVIHLNDGTEEADVLARLRAIAGAARSAAVVLDDAAARLAGVSDGMNQHYNDEEA